MLLEMAGLLESSIAVNTFIRTVHGTFASVQQVKGSLPGHDLNQSYQTSNNFY